MERIFGPNLFPLLGRLMHLLLEHVDRLFEIPLSEIVENEAVEISSSLDQPPLGWVGWGSPLLLLEGPVGLVVLGWSMELLAGLDPGPSFGLGHFLPVLLRKYF